MNTIISRRYYAVFKQYGKSDYTQISIWFDDEPKAKEFLNDYTGESKNLIILSK
jgi:hypothetical protein